MINGLEDVFKIMRTSFSNMLTHRYLKNEGICGNFSLMRQVFVVETALAKADYYPLALFIFRMLVCRWPKYSGNPNYPIPGLDLGETSDFHANTAGGKLWIGDYGALRFELLNYLVFELSVLINASAISRNKLEAEIKRRRKIKAPIGQWDGEHLIISSFIKQALRTCPITGTHYGDYRLKPSDNAIVISRGKSWSKNTYIGRAMNQQAEWVLNFWDVCQVRISDFGVLYENINHLKELRVR